VLQIKLFAVDLLSDLVGPDFGAFDPREIECKFSFTDSLVFATNLAYVVQRELDLLDPTELNYLTLTQNGLFGKS
jgi:hypothetical protein